MAIHPIQTTRRRVLPVLSIGILGLTVVLILILVLAAIAENPTLPAGTTWGGVPVDGLSVDEAVSRVREVYSTPLALVYRGQTIQVPPEQLGF
jgi:hypothetical protein